MYLEIIYDNSSVYFKKCGEQNEFLVFKKTPTWCTVNHKVRKVICDNFDLDSKYLKKHGLLVENNLDHNVLEGFITIDKILVGTLMGLPFYRQYCVLHILRSFNR